MDDQPESPDRESLNSDSATGKKQPKTGFVVRQPKQMTVQTENLGLLQIDNITVGLLFDLEKDVLAIPEASHQTLVKRLLKRTAHLAPTEGKEATELLSDEQIQEVTTEDLEMFAKVFLRNADWYSKAPTDDTSDASSIQTLSLRIRTEIKCHSDEIKRQSHLLRSGFSDHTLRLIEESNKLSANLNGFGISSAIKAAKEHGAYQDIVKYAAGTDSLLKSLNQNSTIAAAIQAAKSTPRESITSLLDELSKEKFSIDTKPILAVPNHTKEISKKVDQVASKLDDRLEEVAIVANEIAALHGATNAALLSALSDIQIQRNKDEKSAKWTLRLGVFSLLVSAGISIASYIQDQANNRSNDAMQAQVQKTMVKQESLLRDISNAEERRAKTAGEAASQNLGVSEFLCKRGLG